MYITRVEIQNIRSIKHLVWEIDAADAPGWHVILGDNGSGKSTFIRCTAISLIEQNFGNGFVSLPLLPDWFTWIRADESIGSFASKAITDSRYDTLSVNNIELFVGQDIRMESGVKFDSNYRLPFKEFSVVSSESVQEYADQRFYFNGFFSVSYGSFRNFNESGTMYDHLFDTSPWLARHLSAFDDRIGLNKSLEWIKGLRFKQLDPIDGDKDASRMLESVKHFVNQNNFLEYGVKLSKVSSLGVTFSDGSGAEVAVQELSAGYRSVLSLTFELLRQLSIAYGPDIFEAHDGGKVTVKVPGVVQIDEVDAHLHPTWQKRIGFWFREHFPQMQFIVTTHSPLVCQAAEKGSIFLLPRPGTDETGRMLEGAERDRLLYGDITDAYSTEAFGGGDTRSPKGQEMLNRLGELNVKEMLQGLSKEEMQEQERLRAAMPASASQVI